MDFFKVLASTIEGLWETATRPKLLLEAVAQSEDTGPVALQLLQPTYVYPSRLALSRVPRYSTVSASGTSRGCIRHGRKFNIRQSVSRSISVSRPGRKLWCLCECGPVPRRICLSCAWNGMLGRPRLSLRGAYLQAVVGSSGLITK